MNVRPFAFLFVTFLLQACTGSSSSSITAPPDAAAGADAPIPDAAIPDAAISDAPVDGRVGNDPSLASLVPSTGTLSPAFDAATTAYTLTVPAAATSVSFTPTAADPAHMT